ncbi:MAG: hypothetical protein KC910_14845 [Candidatus Eremiobacteraeota bacterium]|nr:hypothetical protein [Candidatus Eremiobacteraeota bacterium]
MLKSRAFEPDWLEGILKKAQSYQLVGLQHPEPRRGVAPFELVVISHHTLHARPEPLAFLEHCLEGKPGLLLLETYRLDHQVLERGNWPNPSLLTRRPEFDQDEPRRLATMARWSKQDAVLECELLLEELDAGGVVLEARLQTFTHWPLDLEALSAWARQHERNLELLHQVRRGRRRIEYYGLG